MLAPETDIRYCYRYRSHGNNKNRQTPQGGTTNKHSPTEHFHI